MFSFRNKSVINPNIVLPATKNKMAYPLYLKKEPKRTDVPMALLLLAISSLALAVVIVAGLEPEERISSARGSCLLFLGATFFVALYCSFNNGLLRTSIGQKVIRKYRLTQCDVLDISNKLVSMVQALISCITGVLVCRYSCLRDLMKTSHYLSEAYAWFGVSYFFYDIWSMYRVFAHTPPTMVMLNGDGFVKTNDGLKNRKFFTYLKTHFVMVGHHLFIGMFGFSVMVYLRKGFGDCVYSFVYLMEASTPFVSLRGILARFNMKTSKFYVVNGLLMVASFFVFRIAIFPYVMHMYAQAIGKSYFPAVATLPAGCKVSIAILLLPQVYWFYLMVKGASKVLQVRNSKSGEKSDLLNAKRASAAKKLRVVKNRTWRTLKADATAK